jgi:hypothetical protein
MEENKKSNDMYANAIEQLMSEHGKPVLILLSVVILLFMLPYLLNGSAKTIRGFKNLCRAIKE